MVLRVPWGEGRPLLGGGGGGGGGGGTGLRSSAAVVAEKARARMTNGSQKERMADVIRELEFAAESTAWWWKLVMLITIFYHFVGGTVAIHLLEGWSFGDALYFCVVVTTTVGYGDMAPQTALGKSFVCYYVLAAVCLVSSILSLFVGTLIDRQEEALMAIVTGEDDDEDVEVVAHAPPTQPTPSPVGQWLRNTPVLRRISYYRWLDNTDWIDDYRPVFYTALVFLVVGVIGACIFKNFERLSLLDSIYVTIISATTVGFGDIDPVQRTTKTLMSVWLVVSTVLLAKLVGDQSEAHAKTRQRAASRRLLSARITTRSLATMDRDGDGKISRCDFLSALLVRTGKAEQTDIDAILARFAQLDKDGSGAIALSELPTE